VVRQAAGAAPDATTADLLPLTIAAFKTPMLRDLRQSAPYFHDGLTDTLEDAVAHYLGVSSQARARRGSSATNLVRPCGSGIRSTGISR